MSKEHDGAIVHTIGVCQPAVPLIAAIARMEAQDSPHVPASMTLMGGAIDARRSLQSSGAGAWQYVVCAKLHSCFLQLTGFMAINIDRHIIANLEFFDHLVAGDGDSARKHREF